MKKVFLAFMALAAFSIVSCTEEVNEPPQAVLDGPSVVRVNAPVVFDASKSTDKDGTIDLASITFDFGDGGEKLKGVSSASHVFKTKGDYKVAVELADDKGAAGSAARSISVTDNVTPLAKLTGPATARLGATVTFDAGGSTDSDGVIKDYSFDFGDKSPAVAGVSNASHAFAAAGAYAVTVTVTDNDGATATAAVQVTVTDNLPRSRS